MKTASPNPSIPGLDLNSDQPRDDSRTPQPESISLSNDDVAERLEQVAELMETQRANECREFYAQQQAAVSEASEYA